MAAKETRVSHVQMETSVTCKSSSQRYTYRYIFFPVHYGILGFMDVKPDSFQSQMWVHQSLQVLSLGAWCRVQSLHSLGRNSRFVRSFMFPCGSLCWWWCFNMTLFQPLVPTSTSPFLPLLI